MLDIRKIAEGAGLNAEALDRIKLGRGIVGKSSYVAAAVVLVLGAVALRTSSVALLAVVVVAAVVVFVLFFFGILWFATRNPGLALLEGAELIQWRQMDMGVKGATSVPQGPNTEPPPQIEGPR
jgi:hypothetical protein